MGVEERLSLDAVSEHTLIAVEHRHRYAFALPACAGKRVLDLCCGAGYGSEMIAAVADTVTGVDRDAAAIDTAQATVGARTSAQFVAADALDHLRRVEPADVDVIVCFEGLEHLPDVDKVAEQLVRLVAGGAGLLASVPNSATFEEENEFHLTDFDLPSARALFADLPDAVIAYQNHAEGSLIRGEQAPSVQVEVQLDGEQDLGWANHFLILAGVDHEALLSGASAALHVAVAPVNHRYMRGLERANRSLQATNAQLTRERLGLGAAGGAAAVLRREDELESTRGERDEARARADELAARADALQAERDDYRRAWMAVTSSRLTNLAARIAGHRFER
jgi:SAM-dependent methyltransferase